VRTVSTDTVLSKTVEEDQQLKKTDTVWREATKKNRARWKSFVSTLRSNQSKED